MVKYLLDNSANVNQNDENGMTVLMKGYKLKFLFMKINNLLFSLWDGWNRTRWKFIKK